MGSDQYPELDPRRLLTVVLQRIWMIAAIVAVAFVGVYFYSSSQPDIYESSAEVRVVRTSETFIGSSGRVDPQRELTTEMYLMRSGGVRSQVIERLGSAEAFEQVRVTDIPETDIVRITVSARTPEAARDSANAFATVYLEARQIQEAGVFNQRAADLIAFADVLTERVAEIDALLTLGPSQAETDALSVERAGLLQQQSQFLLRAFEFQVEGDLRRDGVEVIETARLPTSPVSPVPLRDAVLAAVLALFFSAGLAFLLEWIDNHIRTPEDLESAAPQIPVIGTIPMYGPGGLRRAIAGRSERSERTLVPLSSPAAEAYRTLQTSLRFSSLGKTKQRIAITSSMGGEGKSTVTANLAMVLAESGLRVVVISADLRRPTIGSIFGVDETEKGLTSILLGDASPADCLVPVTFDSGRSLYLLPAGPLPHNPAELLGSPAFGPLLERIEAAGVDFILLDCAPVLPVSDPLAVAQNVDGVIVMSLSGRTKEGSYVETIDRLEQVEADIIGTVLNGMPTKRRYYGYYGYHRYGSYSYAPKATAAREGRERARSSDGEDATPMEGSASAAGGARSFFKRPNATSDVPSDAPPSRS